jgi:phenylpropionate dioxygenase-like ring-hydroxylating dioxygenase large terminal subunit
VKVALPLWPRGWYVVARAEELRLGAVLTRRLGGRELVLFRAGSDRIAALDAHCPHMGTHLRHGRVRGAELECPMHHWCFDAEGIARRQEQRCGSTATAIVTEAHGLVFVWLGSEPPGGAPIPAAPPGYRWRTGGPVAVSTSWHSLIVSGFDMDHFEAVHRRRLLGPPEITTSESGQLRLRYRSEVVGRDLADRMIRWLSGGRIEVTMTCSGTLVVVDSAAGGRRTSAVLGLLPTPEGVLAYGSFGMPDGTWLPSLQLHIATWLYLRFLRKDFAIIEGSDLRTDVLDAGVRAMTAFLAALPDESGVG